MRGLARPSRAALARLRAFRWFPPAGGFGGDFDTLEAELEARTDGELARLRERLGPSGEARIAGHAVQLSFVGLRARVLLAVYASDADVERALEIEAWLEAEGILPLAVESDGATAS